MYLEYIEAPLLPQQPAKSVGGFLEAQQLWPSIAANGQAVGAEAVRSYIYQQRATEGRPQSSNLERAGDKSVCGGSRETFRFTSIQSRYANAASRLRLGPPPPPPPPPSLPPRCSSTTPLTPEWSRVSPPTTRSPALTPRRQIRTVGYHFMMAPSRSEGRS